MGKVLKIGIYQIKNKKNGLIYIGSSNNIDKRWKEHKRELNSNRHKNRFIQADWNEFGEDEFEFLIIEECDVDERYEIEQEYLDRLLPYNRNNRGYNINENSKRKNMDGVRIYKDRYYRFNPFYKKSESEIKKMLKSGDYQFYKIEDIKTNNMYEWYSVHGDYYVIKIKGHIPRIIDHEDADNMTRESMVDYCEAMDTYDFLKDLAREGYMDYDDWC